MSKITPLPWAARPHSWDDCEWEVYPTRGGPPEYGEWSAVCTCEDQHGDDNEAKANAELIVRAVNNHEALLSALAGLYAAMAAHENTPEEILALAEAERTLKAARE